MRSQNSGGGRSGKKGNDTGQEPRERELSSREAESDTDRGYDEAAHSGRSRYGDVEGRGGVFGTTGGGSYDGGFQVIERPALYDRSESAPFESERPWRSGRTYGRDAGRYDSVSLDMNVDTPGPHSGKGPKNYRRSDERIREEVSEMLMRHGEIDASDIEVEVAEGVVTLRGSVDTRRTKRLAEDIVDSVRGVEDVRNEIKPLKGLFR
jgi:osmotically-inducible protein OsmY